MQFAIDGINIHNDDHICFNVRDSGLSYYFNRMNDCQAVLSIPDDEWQEFRKDAINLIGLLILSGCSVTLGKE